MGSTSVLEYFKDPKKPFIELQELTSKTGWWKALLENNNVETVDLSTEEEASYDAVFSGQWKIMEFILVGFNRKSDIKKGIYRV